MNELLDAHAHGISVTPDLSCNQRRGSFYWQLPARHRKEKNNICATACWATMQAVNDIVPSIVAECWLLQYMLLVQVYAPESTVPATGLLFSRLCGQKFGIHWKRVKCLHDTLLRKRDPFGG